MSKEIKAEQKEMLNDVQNMNIPEKRYSDNSGLLYKNIIKCAPQVSFNFF